MSADLEPQNALVPPAAAPTTDTPELQRRGFLRAAAGVGVAATGITGFPFVHAQEKIVLRYLGTAVNQDKAIAEKFEADTGIKIHPFQGARQGASKLGE